MAYTPNKQKTWKDGDVITAAALNSLEANAYNGASLAVTNEHDIELNELDHTLFEQSIDAVQLTVTNLLSALGIKGDIAASGFTNEQKKSIIASIGAVPAVNDAQGGGVAPNVSLD